MYLYPLSSLPLIVSRVILFYIILSHSNDVIHIIIKHRTLSTSKESFFFVLVFYFSLLLIKFLMLAYLRSLSFLYIIKKVNIRKTDQYSFFSAVLIKTLFLQRFHKTQRKSSSLERKGTSYKKKET